MRNRVLRRWGAGLSLVVLGIAIGRLFDVLPAIAQEGTEDAPAQASETVPEGQPRYLAAMRTELEHMGIAEFACQATDAQRAMCELTQHGSSSGRDYRLRALYSDRTDTVYLYVERYLVAPQDGAGTNALMRRLMELNWQMLLGKFEWDPTDGEVRLAMILNTDSNFDRRAFRSSVRGLTQLADRYWSELDRIQRATPAP
ncbi:MAG: YbjN domain-containing protein [Myxococcota bacterium]|nr:YbjN domain-containing protein [Myxococcota bacterium]